MPVAKAALGESEAVPANDLSVRHGRLPAPCPEEQLALLLTGQALDAPDLACSGTLGDRAGSHLVSTVLAALGVEVVD